MQQIFDWLKQLGMSEYAERFVENHIDESIIRDLTDQDLKDLGVGSMGHQRQLLRDPVARRPPSQPPNRRRWLRPYGLPKMLLSAVS